MSEEDLVCLWQLLNLFRGDPGMIREGNFPKAVEMAKFSVESACARRGLLPEYERDLFPSARPSK